MRTSNGNSTNRFLAGIGLRRKSCRSQESPARPFPNPTSPKLKPARHKPTFGKEEPICGNWVRPFSQAIWPAPSRRTQPSPSWPKAPLGRQGQTAARQHRRAQQRQAPRTQLPRRPLSTPSAPRISRPSVRPCNLGTCRGHNRPSRNCNKIFEGAPRVQAPVRERAKPTAIPSRRLSST